MTFAISARCERSGRFGVGITTRPMAVGARCPFIAPGIGIVVTMATTDPRLGPLGLSLLRQGYSAAKVLAELAASDPHVERRQLSVIDRDGNAAARTGTGNKVWSGHTAKRNLVAMGNNLTSERTVSAMLQAFESRPGDEIEERLLRAIEAGRDAGGQNGGQHSANLVSYDRETYAYVDLRVDEHAEPVGELRRLYDLYRPTAPYFYQRPGRPDEFPSQEGEWLATQRTRNNP